jgi:sigma-E factor negative regulatory protein RseC
MIEERAVVLSVSAGVARVQAIRRSTCGACSARGACGTSLLDRFLGRRPLELELEDTIGLAPGEEVVVGVPEEALLISSFVAYMLPLLGLIGAALIGAELAQGLAPGAAEGWSLFAGMTGLVVSLLWVRARSRRMGADPRWQARLMRRAGATSSTSVAVELRGAPR